MSATDERFRQQGLVFGIAPAFQPDHGVDLLGIVGHACFGKSFFKTDSKGIDTADRLGNGLGRHGAHILVTHQSGHIPGQVFTLIHAHEIIAHVLIVFLVTGAMLKNHIRKILGNDHGRIHVLEGGGEYYVIAGLGISADNLFGVCCQNFFRVGNFDLIAQLLFEILNSTVMGRGPPHIIDGPKQRKGHLCFCQYRCRKNQTDAQHQHDYEYMFFSHSDFLLFQVNNRIIQIYWFCPAPTSPPAVVP